MSAGQVTSRAREGRRLIHLLWLGVPADDQRRILQALHEAGRAVVSQSADQLVGLRDRGLRKSDVLLTDGASSSLSPTAVVEEVAAARCDVPVVVLIDAGHETRVVEWMGRGVRDCVARDKPASIAAVIARESSAVGVRRAFARRGRWLDERKHRSAGLLESFYEVYYRSTLDGIILEISPSVKAQGGYEPEELIGQHVRMVYADESRRDAILDGLRAHGKIQDHPIVLRKKSGELREALLMARLIRDSNGVPVGIEGALRDVTEGRRVAEALRQSEERYRQLVESAADPIFTLDREGRFLFVNGRAADYFGRKATDLVGTEMGEWFPAEMAARQMEGVRTVIETRVSQTFESPSLIRGEEYWFSASISPILDAKGEPIAAQVIARDVTVRRRLELQLRRSEERYRTLVESAGDGIAIVDAQGVCHFANAALGRLFEVEAAALLGVGGGGQLSSEASERLVATVRSVIEAGVGRTIEAPFPLRGTTRWFSVEVRPTDWVGVLGACVRIDVREITELKGAEAALRRERDLARRYLDLAGTMIVLVQSDGRIGLVNRRGCDLTGYQEWEIVGRDWLDLLVPDRLRAVRAGEVAALLAHGTTPAGRREGPIVTKSGAERILVWDQALLTDEGGTVAGVLMSGEDITERVLSARAIEEARDFLSAVLDTIGDPVVVKDEQHRLVLVNEAYCALVGREARAVLGRTEDGLFPAPQMRAIRERDRDVLESGVESVSEEQLVDAQGREQVLLTRTARYRRKGGERFIVGVSRDVNAMKRAAERLRETERLYRTLAENIPNGSVFLFDRRLRFTLAEGTGLGNVGPPREEIIGRTPCEVFPPEVCAILESAYRSALDGHSALLEVPFLGRIYETHVLPVRTERDEVAYGMVMTQDITARKQAVEERERLIVELRAALASIKTLRGLIPICSACKKIRDDRGYWQQVEDYVRAHSEAVFSHGLCGDCARRLYPEFTGPEK